MDGTTAIQTNLLAILRPAPCRIMQLCVAQS